MRQHIRKPKTNRDEDDLKVVVVGMFVAILLLVFVPSEGKPSITDTTANAHEYLCHMTHEVVSE